MKKILFILICSISASVSFSQISPPHTSICPAGSCFVHVLHGPIINFHTPRTGCKRQFGFCIRGNILTTQCLPCLRNGSENNTNIEKGMVQCWGQIVNGQLEFHIPAEISKEPGFTDEDLSIFSIEDATFTISDGDKKLANKQGDYPVELKENDLVVLIDLK